MFEMVITNDGSTRWEWQVRDRGGRAILLGWEETREAARYRCQCALFLLLLTPTWKNA